jgi:hypothetical protein
MLFATDGQLAARVRAVAAQLRQRGAPGGLLSALTLELEDIAGILDPADTHPCATAEHDEPLFTAQQAENGETGELGTKPEI